MTPISNERQILASVWNLRKDNYIALYDLIKKSSDPAHPWTGAPFTDSSKALKDLGLISEEGEVLDRVKTIVNKYFQLEDHSQITVNIPSKL